MSASGQKQPLNSIQILASEWLLSGYTGHSPLRISERLLSARSGHSNRAGIQRFDGQQSAKSGIELTFKLKVNPRFYMSGSLLALC